MLIFGVYGVQANLNSKQQNSCQTAANWMTTCQNQDLNGQVCHRHSSNPSSPNLKSTCKNSGWKTTEQHQHFMCNILSAFQSSIDNQASVFLNHWVFYFTSLFQQRWWNINNPNTARCFLGESPQDSRLHATYLRQAWSPCKSVYIC